MTQLAWLNPDTPFPETAQALLEPNGLLAAGGDLSPSRLLSAYQQGIFPWYSEDQPILWWSPDPRCVIYPDQVHYAKSLKKHIRKNPPHLTFDTAFDRVIQHCARLDSESGTWITAEMQAAYAQLHHLGHAHSIEVWHDGELTGGLYGLAIGKAFFGESMFSHQPNASKIAFVALCRQLSRWDYQLIDCQVENSHLLSLGATTIARALFLNQLKTALGKEVRHTWVFDSDIFND